MDIGQNGSLNTIDRTEDFWEESNMVLLFKYCAPVLLIVGTIGNLIAVITLQSRLFKSSSTSFLLSTLALCDVFVLNTGLLNRYLQFSFDINTRLFSHYGCKVHNLLTYYSHQIASWTLVLLTAERTISVTFPLRCREFCNKRRIIPVWVGMAVNLFCCNIHFFFSYDIKVTVTQTNGNVSSLTFQCALFNSWRPFIIGPWYWINACLGDFIPFLVVLFGNAIIIIHLMRSSKMRTQDIRLVGKKDGKISSTIVVLILVSIIFLISNVSMDFYFLSYGYGLFQDTNLEQDAVSTLFFAGISVVYYSNSAMEFALYFVSGRKFRSAFLDIFGCSTASGGISRNMTHGTRSGDEDISMTQVQPWIWDLSQPHHV